MDGGWCWRPVTRASRRPAPATGPPKQLTDAELVTLAVAQALLGFRIETRWLRYAFAHLRSMFAYLPNQPGCNKRLRSVLPLAKTEDPGVGDG